MFECIRYLVSNKECLGYGYDIGCCVCLCSEGLWFWGIPLDSRFLVVSQYGPGPISEVTATSQLRLSPRSGPPPNTWTDRKRNGTDISDGVFLDWQRHLAPLGSTFARYGSSKGRSRFHHKFYGHPTGMTHNIL